MYAEKMAGKYTGCKVGFSQFGLRRSLSDSQVDTVADEWHADSAALSLAKRLVVAKSEPAWRRMTQAKSLIRRLWVEMTSPYIEPGIRLVGNHRVVEFVGLFETAKAEYDAAVTALDAEWAEIVSRAKDRLGELYDPADYPLSIADKFGVSLDFVSLEPPSYLLKLSPELYEQQKQAMLARLEASAAKAEQELAERLHQMVLGLADKLSGLEDGVPKKFRTSSLENIREFFDGLEEANITENKVLAKAAAEARELVEGYSAADLGGTGKALNDHQAALRTSIAMGMESIGKSLESMLVAKPGRKLLLSQPVQKEFADEQDAGE